MNTEPIINNKPLDIEICALMGDAPSDFIVLYANGAKVPFYGTPYDSAQARKNMQFCCDELNKSDGKSWAKFFTNWSSEFVLHFKLGPDANPVEFRPVFSWRIHRVCPAYSEHFHAAVQLLEKLSSRIRFWSITSNHIPTELIQNTPTSLVRLRAINGTVYQDEAPTPAKAICLALRHMLAAETQS